MSESTPNGNQVSGLQTQFNGLLAKFSQPAAKAGFFGGQQAVKTPQIETLVIDTLKLILEEAVRMQASDVHVEPLENVLRVRFRLDGLLTEVLKIPRALDMRVVSLLRVNCGLDPEQGAATGKPQDGRMAVTVDGQEADLRLSTFPTSYGDKAVLRVIPRHKTIPKLEELGLRPGVLELLREIISRPQGMVIVSGPAGTGKSTTLYTMLQALNSPARNIVTLEDPIELKIEGITQGAVQSRIGLTFSEGLRSILRQDPNVIMVGEIRDRETAEIAMSAALTGHLLFTTLHTNSALGAVARLLDMGLEPFLISSALSAVFAQRLARRLCMQCREPVSGASPTLALAEKMALRSGVAVSANFFKSLYRSKGCPACRQTGYLGRMLLFEAVVLSSALRQQILRKAALDDMRKTAAAEGTETLLLDGFHKVAAGLTSIEELIRVAGVND